MVEMVERAACLAGVQGEKNRELNLIFVSEQTIRKINDRYLGRNRRTDVIAFNLGPVQDGFELPKDAEDCPEEEGGILGEIYICPRVASQTAPSYKTTPETEITLYIVHGLLHLASYEDDTSENQAGMRKAEKRIMKILQQEFSINSVLRIEES